MRVIDADAHVEESTATWEHIEPEFYERRPVPLELPQDTSWGEHNAVWFIDYKARKFAASPTLMRRAHRRDVKIPSQELTDVSARLADLDKYGIEKQVIYPSTWLGCLAEDLDLEKALTRSYNTYMATQCNQSGGRLHYVAVIPFRDPAAAAEEIRRVKSLGSAVALFVRGMEWDLPITHPMFRPIYEEAQAQDLVMGLHIGFGSPTINRMFEGMPRVKPDPFPHIHPLSRNLLSGLLVQYAFGGLIASAVLQDFPRLRWVILETGCEWLVPAIRAHNQRTGKDASSYFREGQISVSCEPFEDLAHVAACLGDDCFVVASDMPHGDDFSHDRVEEAFRERGDLSEPVLEKILWRNASRLYGI